MNVYEALTKRRTIRKFLQQKIPHQILTKLVNAGRLAPSGSNLQPIEYVIIEDDRLLPGVFSTLSWAGYIAPAGNPQPGEEPVAYIAVLVNKKIKEKDYGRDVGAAVQNILLAAMEERIGSCWIGSVAKNKLRLLLNLPGHLIIDSVIALGYPAESPVGEEMKDSIKYWKDEQGTLHVPKRGLEDICHLNCYGVK